MDQIKIGKFIASCRKNRGMTQANLAEKLGISDRAVSKWETGKSMPDYDIIPELCEMLEININELFSGERIMSEEYDKKAEENLLELKAENDENVKRLLKSETWIFVTGLISGFLLFAAGAIVAHRNAENETLAVVLCAVGIAAILLPAFFCIRIEQKAGYYECAECGHRYKPTSYWKVMLAPHLNTTRKMKCPECGKRSWQKKVINKGEDA